MYIYLFKSDDQKYKIGSSKNPIKRLKQLQTGNGNPLKIAGIFKTKHNKKVETTLHNIYKINRTVGEWFELPNELEQNFMIECENIERTLDSLKKSGNPFI